MADRPDVMIIPGITLEQARKEVMGRSELRMLKVTIEIPTAFAKEFKDDRFEHTLRRLSADAHSVAGNYEKETAMMLIKAFSRATVVDGD